ncbi:hypothetical protein GCM10012275_04670 [Longimycelium tulufanense]|uniref:SPW repeat-containing integral membrane domain-containing protein n=1 Tax=Longimycelium tulufanense TaxID=907463 RepID=A0A8J3C630_9PSEU|nr:SPW repeat protein [Longimycelium tulufanense]GGM36521.1 hypothetical protein GCM10012275_04670 [Longimycelium tulufanense]
MTTHPGIEQHPDLVAMRERYDRAAETPQAQAVDSLTFLAGLYLAISPWVLEFHGSTTLAVSNLVTGVALAVLALGYATMYDRMHRMAWVAPAIGIWTIVSPWAVLGTGATVSMVLSNVITGGLVVLLGIGVAVLGLAGRARQRAEA